MPLNIKDRETDRLVRELAELTGESITDAVKAAVQERIERHRASANSGVAAALMAIAERGRKLPRLTDKSDDEIIGYNEFGVPS